MTPTLPEEAVKAAESELSRIIGEWERNREFFNVTPEAKKNFIRRQASALSALEPSAAQVQVSGNSGQLKSAPDMGNPITDKTVKRRVADALESVWSALDCDVDQIERVITHMLANGLRIVETVAPVSDGVDTIEVGIPATELSTASKMEVVAETGIPATEPSAARELALEKAARNAAMYLATGFITCPRCGEDVETKNTDAEYTLRAALSSPEPSDHRETVLYEAARKAQKAIAAILASGGLESDKWWDDLVSAQQSLATAIRALSSPDHADAGKVEGDGWLPIESAPKDGTHFIGWDGKWAFRCSAGKKYVLYPHMDGGPTYRDVWDGHYYDSLTIEHPTHWRHLPSAPSEGEE